MQSLTVQDRVCLLNNHNVYIVNTSMSILNSTGVADGLPCNARDRKATGLKRDFFNYWNTGVDLGSSAKVWH